MKRQINKKRVLELDLKNKSRDEITKKLQDARKKCRDDDEYIQLVRNTIYEYYDPKRIKEIIGMKNISDPLYKLLEGFGINGLSASNLSQQYLKYQCGKYEVSDFLEDIDELFISLVVEVDTLLFGKSINKEDMRYERS